MAEKELEVLREEYRQLASRLARTALLGLFLLFILINTFSRAYSRVNGDEARAILEEIHRLSKVTQDTPELSFIFAAFSGRPEEEESPAEPIAVPPEKVQKAKDRQLELARALEEKAASWFTISPSVLGSDLEFDVRYWIFLLPALFWVVGSHLYILRTKLELVRRLGAHQLQSDAGSATLLDRLLFGAGPRRSTAFLRHPSQFESLVYVLCVAGLIANLIIVGWPFWSSLVADVISFVLVVFAILTFYVVAYSRYAARCLEAQAAALLGSTPEPAWVDRIWSRVLAGGRRLSRPVRSRPRLSMASGSLLVLLSLFMATAVSCESAPRKGYELVLGTNDAQWFSGAGWFGGLMDQLLGRSVYTASQGLALLTLLLLVTAEFRDEVLQKTWANSWLWRISGVFSLFLLADFGFNSRLGFSFISDLLRVAYWLVPSLLWCRYTLSRREEVRERWPAVRSGLVLLYAPGFFLGIFTLITVAQQKLTGLLVYFAGLHLMTLGYLGLAEARAPAAQEVQPPVEPKAELPIETAPSAVPRALTG